VLERRRANRAGFGTCARVVRTLNRFRAAIGASAAEQKGHGKPPLRVHASSLSEHRFFWKKPECRPGAGSSRPIPYVSLRVLRSRHTCLLCN
jgi:hypothetical protein